MKKALLTVLFLIAAPAVAAPVTGMSAKTGMTTSRMMSGRMMTGLGRTDTAFLAQATRGNTFELKAAQIALTRSGSASVQRYARQMIADHTKLGSAVKATVGRLSPRTPVPTTVYSSQAAQLSALQSAGPRTFNRLYRSDMIASHAATYALFSKYDSSRSANRTMRSIIRTATPTVKVHLNMAYTLPRA